MAQMLGPAPEAFEVAKAAVLLLAIVLGVGLTLLGAAIDRRARRRDRRARRRYLPGRVALHGLPPGEASR